MGCYHQSNVLWKHQSNVFFYLIMSIVFKQSKYHSLLQTEGSVAIIPLHDRIVNLLYFLLVSLVVILEDWS